MYTPNRSEKVLEDINRVLYDSFWKESIKECEQYLVKSVLLGVLIPLFGPFVFLYREMRLRGRILEMSAGDKSHHAMSRFLRAQRELAGYSYLLEGLRWLYAAFTWNCMLIAIAAFTAIAGLAVLQAVGWDCFASRACICIAAVAFRLSISRRFSALLNICCTGRMHSAGEAGMIMRECDQSLLKLAMDSDRETNRLWLTLAVKSILWMSLTPLVTGLIALAPLPGVLRILPLFFGLVPFFMGVLPMIKRNAQRVIIANLRTAMLYWTAYESYGPQARCCGSKCVTDSDLLAP